MRHTILALLALAIALPMRAQEDNSYIDYSEDANEVTTINDIIARQQLITARKNTSQHYSDVWGRRSYVNIGLNTGAKLNVSEAPHTSAGNPVNDYSAANSFNLQVGRSYRLHKTPIANVALICLDYTGIDLNYSHYKNDGTYNSSETFTEGTDKRYYMPWNLEKHEVSYGMNIGPSITVAPFTYINNIPELHYVKLRAYFHFGFNVSGLLLNNSKEESSSRANKYTYDTSATAYIDSNPIINYAYGTYTTLGIAASWKNVGIGFEQTSRTLSYDNFSHSDFGSDKTMFKAPYTRLYLSIYW